MNPAASFHPLETPRLMLRVLTDDDAPVLFPYRSNPEIFRSQTWKPSLPAEAAEFTRKHTCAFNVGSAWCQMGIVDAENIASIDLLRRSGMTVSLDEPLRNALNCAQTDIVYTIAFQEYLSINTGLSVERQSP